MATKFVCGRRPDIPVLLGLFGLSAGSRYSAEKEVLFARASQLDRQLGLIIEFREVITSKSVAQSVRRPAF